MEYSSRHQTPLLLLFLLEVDILETSHLGRYFAYPTALKVDGALHLHKVDIVQLYTLAIGIDSVGYIKAVAPILRIEIFGAEIVGIAPIKMRIYPMRPIARIVITTSLQAGADKSIGVSFNPLRIVVILFMI